MDLQGVWQTDKHSPSGSDHYPSSSVDPKASFRAKGRPDLCRFHSTGHPLFVSGSSLVTGTFTMSHPWGLGGVMEGRRTDMEVNKKGPFNRSAPLTERTFCSTDKCQRRIGLRKRQRGRQNLFMLDDWWWLEQSPEILNIKRISTQQVSHSLRHRLPNHTVVKNDALKIFIICLKGHTLF